MLKHSEFGSAFPFGRQFYGRTVLVTGHTGFKGAWLALWLNKLGANVVGYSLPADGDNNLFQSAALGNLIDSRIGDINDASQFERVVAEIRPEIVFHLAAQPIVRLSYEHPKETFQTNVMGTVNVLNAVRSSDSVRVCLVVTSDKCYENRETGQAYREGDRLAGLDPYSASKACAELVVASYRHSFLLNGLTNGRTVSLSSARAGNVIGGGDWAQDRLVPDSIRSLMSGRPIVLRNPGSVRPWQFVLEPLSGYLALAAYQLVEPGGGAEAWNFGPAAEDSRTVAQVADCIIDKWGFGSWKTQDAISGKHEAGTLQLDSTKARQRLFWQPIYGVDQATAKTVAWYREAQSKDFDARSFADRQIEDYTAAARAARVAWSIKSPVLGQ